MDEDHSVVNKRTLKKALLRMRLLPATMPWCAAMAGRGKNDTRQSSVDTLYTSDFREQHPLCTPECRFLSP